MLKNNFKKLISVFVQQSYAEHVFGCEKFARKVGHQRPRIVQILLESYPDNSNGRQ